jgi:hypothetical protein
VLEGYRPRFDEALGYLRAQLGGAQAAAAAKALNDGAQALDAKADGDAGFDANEAAQLRAAAAQLRAASSPAPAATAPSH